MPEPTLVNTSLLADASAAAINYVNFSLSNYLPFTGGTMTGELDLGFQFVGGANQIYSDSGGYIDFPNGILGSEEGNALDWINFRLYNYLGNLSVDWTNRQLYDSNVQWSVDWGDRLLYDTTGYLAAVDWGNRSLITSNSMLTVDWEYALLNDPSSFPSVDWASRNLIDDGYSTSVDWGGRYLLDGGYNTSVDWGYRALFDSSNIVAVNWENRNLQDSSGNSMLDWSNSSGSGALDVFASGGITANQFSAPYGYEAYFPYGIGHVGSGYIMSDQGFVGYNGNYTAAHLPFGATFQPNGVALLTGNEGTIAYVMDADTPVIGSAVAGGGSAKCLVCYNGTDWIVTSIL
jgi:hypothetical protein